MKSFAAVFPGQGEQFSGMGKELYDHFLEAKEVFQHADDVLERNLSKLMFSGSMDELTNTKNSQVAIYVHSMAAWSVLKKQLNEFPLKGCAGHSLGEYSALTAAEGLNFKNALKLVQTRANCMSNACSQQRGAMAAVLGLSDEQVIQLIDDMNLPNDLWAANFNCPGQVVISGTERGIEKAVIQGKAAGAKRVIPLKVQGAFHSGLMKDAEDQFAMHVMESPIKKTNFPFAMNVTGSLEQDKSVMQKNLISQITHSVKWVDCVTSLGELSPEFFIEVGPGKALSGFHKRILKGVPIMKFSEPKDLGSIAKEMSSGSVI